MCASSAGRIKKLNGLRIGPQAVSLLILTGAATLLAPPPGPQGGPYLGGLPGQLEGDPLPDLRGQLVQHVGLEAADHHLAEAAMQLVQVGGTAAVPLPPPTKVPAKKEGDESAGGVLEGWRGLHSFTAAPPLEKQFVPRAVFYFLTVQRLCWFGGTFAREAIFV